MYYTEEKQIILYYLGNLARHNIPKTLLDDTIDWLDRHDMELFGMSFVHILNKKHKISTFVDNRDSKPLRHMFTRRDSDKAIIDTRTGRPLSINHIKKLFPSRIRPTGPLNRRIELIAASFKLNAKESELLHFFGSILRISLVESMTNKIFGYHGYSFNTGKFKDMSHFINLSPKQMEILLSQTAPLVAKGLFEVDDDGDISPSDNFRKMLSARMRTTQDIRSLILDEKAKAELTLDDFSYMGENLSFLDRLLCKSLQTRQKGVNILLFGEPGTGKTELAKALAQNAGAELYLLSENRTDEQRDNRIAELCMAGSLLETEPGTMLLMDEAEDVFYREKWTFSKIFINRLLEKNRTPVIWISNDITSMDTAFIRRFTYALQMDTPPLRVRRGIWCKLAAKHKVKLDDMEVNALAQKYKLAPSFAVNALKAARLTGNKQALWQTLNSLENATMCCQGRYKPSEVSGKAPMAFAPKLVNADLDIMDLSRKIIAKDIRCFSLCLYGVPGTGKSAYARYLAQQLGLEVLHKRASDLLSMFVGGTEANIAKAFKEARDDEALLVFDEADSFLQDRTQAVRSWEITAVNEMLTWMESHPYPFVCTTNLMTSLDAASLRRFTFKVRFDFLAAGQLQAAFTHFFRQIAPPEIRNMQYLTPGDFAVVRSKAQILKINDSDAILQMLAAEQSHKDMPPPFKMGF